jgi:hypothetical protein
MRQRMWNNVVMFLFHEIYPIAFVNKFNFVSYIIRWKNSFHIIHALEIFKMQMPLRMNKLNRILFTEAYLFILGLCTYF